MRTSFVNTLIKIAKQDKNVILLTADLGFTVFEEFKKNLSEQYLNVGVAEQNMMAIATGLALSGKKVYTYSITPFAVYRCYEQIRNDVCFHNADVKVVGVGGGFSYGIMGSTHHALEDIAVMKVLPNMKIVCPGDPVEVEEAMQAIYKEKGPFYLRLGKKGEKTLNKKPLNYKIGKATTLIEGNDLTIASTGNMLETALEVAHSLLKNSVNARVLSFHTVKPLDVKAVVKAANETKKIFTLEEHFYEGGFGSSISDALTENNVQCFIKKFAVKNQTYKMCGTQEYLRELNGLTQNQIQKTILELLKC